LRKRWLNWKFWAGFIAFAGAIAVFFLLNPGTPRLALFWVFGLAFGFIVQRSRFCFVSAISNFFLFKDGRLLKGILGGLAVATIGFAIIMYRQVADPASGIPATAYVAPFGWHLVLAGAIFGLGMMLAGGCIMGTLYRIGEGAVASLVALLGIIIGMGVLQHNWSWWWNNYISHLPNVWLPAHIGWIAAVALTLAAIGLLYWLVASKKNHDAVAGESNADAESVSLESRLSSIGRGIFVNDWPLALGGVILGIGNILLYQTAERPWGLTGEVMRWTQNVLSAVHLSAPPIATVPGT
jgi:uncharacterized membrane protein YedE/YeeE